MSFLLHIPKTSTDFIDRPNKLTQSLDMTVSHIPKHVNVLDKGQHEIPFKFKLPHGLPENVEAPRGFIRYYCFATIERPWRSKKSSKKYPIVVKTVSTDISNISNGNEQNSRLFQSMGIESMPTIRDFLRRSIRYWITDDRNL
uniref:Arrestin-like N-terminal domain-containing protein n=1 Tax=Acrobeloides nanus TaxID=290746 RepID=A0A914C9I2_9BILA